MDGTKAYVELIIQVSASKLDSRTPFNQRIKCQSSSKDQSFQEGLPVLLQSRELFPLIGERIENSVVLYCAVISGRAKVLQVKMVSGVGPWISLKEDAWKKLLELVRPGRGGVVAAVTTMLFKRTIAPTRSFNSELKKKEEARVRHRCCELQPTTRSLDSLHIPALSVHQIFGFPQHGLFCFRWPGGISSGHGERRVRNSNRPRNSTPWRFRF